MNNLNSEFQNFMGCMIESTLSNLKSENAEYGKCRENERSNVKKIDEILNKLSSEDKKFMESHELGMFNIAAIEQGYLYKQGYMDCIKLLKILGVI